MQINVDDVTEEQARAIETALTDKVFKAQAIMMGVLSTLPSDRARRRILRFIQDKLDEDSSGQKMSKMERRLTDLLEEIIVEAPESEDTRHGRLLGEYSTLMHEFGIDSGQAKQWLAQHKDDKQLMEMASVARSLKKGLFAQVKQAPPVPYVPVVRYRLLRDINLGPAAEGEPDAILGAGMEFEAKLGGTIGDGRVLVVPTHGYGPSFYALPSDLHKLTPTSDETSHG